MIKIEKNEQFAILKPEVSIIDLASSQEIEKRISGLYREGYSNYIFEFNDVNELSDDAILLIKKVEKLCKNENGILVITTENEDIISELDFSKIDDLVIMGTKEEAIEAIYINELENDFREEEDNESSDEFGEENASDYE